MLSFESDFDEMFGDVDFFERRIMKKLQMELDEILNGIKTGEIKGTFETRQIDEPDVKGYIIHGRFGFDESLEPVEPLKPLRRRPRPERPFEVPRDALKEIREPLTDIFEEENAVKVYVELPGEEEGDIKLNVVEDSLEINGKSFHKVIELPRRNIAPEALSSEYKNGVLKITIPKKTRLREKDAKEARMV
jgi:HSP20 family molecular chaperone IbpA